MSLTAKEMSYCGTRRAYGRVKRGNKTFYRYYGREIKNGLTIGDVAGEQWFFAQSPLLIALMGKEKA